ncbi:MAG: hypothetical protein IKO12_03965 [Bacteroidaceae bacterium]|nr:hypothetical protein [Bacteroidaceae bacterium]
MKRTKIVLLLFSLMAWGSNIKADNVITANDVNIRPGGTTELVVSLENDADFNVYAYDFRLYLPDGIEVAKKDNGSYIYELKERNADHGTNVQMTSDGAVQFGVNSPELYLTGTSGPVLGITLKASAELAEGNYQASIQRITYANKEAQTVHPADITFNIVVKDLVVLDETATEAPAPTDGPVNVQLNRTIKGGEWSTIVLPFAATGDQVKAAYGDDVQLSAFTDWSKEEDDNGAIIAINVNFTEAAVQDGIPANTPMLIKVSENVTEATFDGVTLEPDEEPMVRVGKTASKRGYFYGTYVTTQVPEENVFICGNKFYYSRGATTIKGYRGYFLFHDVLDAYYAGADVKFNFNIGGHPTAIEGISTAEAKGAAYDLGGRRIARPQQRGIYIVDGRKKLVY